MKFASILIFTTLSSLARANFLPIEEGLKEEVCSKQVKLPNDEMVHLESYRS